VTQGDRLALVTGTSSGIGVSLARQLVSRGWQVVGISRRAAAFSDRAYLHLRFDLADISSLATGIEAVIGRLVSVPRLARVGLVNNAADLALLGPVARIDPKAMLRVFAVNVASPTWLMGLVARRVASDVPVRVVNVSSGAAVQPLPGLGAYGSTKAALRLLGQIMGSELDDGRDITILSYAPGPIDTPMQAAARAAPREIFPLVETFTGWATSGALLPPEAPAGEIASYLETDGHPRFSEAKSTDVPPALDRPW